MKTPPWLLAAPGSIRDGAVIELEPAEGRHVTGALRLREGDEIVLADGRGQIAAAYLAAVSKAMVRAEVMSVETVPEPSGEGVTLALAIIEAKAMDWAVQKAVEIGIRRFLPIVTDRTQAGGRASPGRLAHWRRVALQALKQCRRAWGMEILDIEVFSSFVADRTDGGVVADQNGLTLGRCHMPRDRVLIVGPEGGFSAVEDELLTRKAWSRLCLGGNVLRSETAAVVGGAMMIASAEDWLA